jgi:hypothetical protein
MSVCRESGGAGAGRRAGPAAVLLLLSLGATAASGDGLECSSEWSLSARGIGIGAASDRVGPAPDGGYLVWSDFRPNSFLAMFGVDPAKREFVVDAHGAAARRTEWRGGGQPETNQWQRLPDGGWERSLNGRADKHQDPGADMLIDSTSFPYLLHLGMVPPSATSRAVAVVAKGKIYPATLKVAPLELGSSEAWRVDFDSQDGHGRAWLAGDLHPLRVEFTDEHGTLRGQLRSWRCH